MFSVMMQKEQATLAADIGIRLIMAKADEIRYNRSIELNNLTIAFRTNR